MDSPVVSVARLPERSSSWCDSKTTTVLGVLVLVLLLLLVVTAAMWPRRLRNDDVVMVMRTAAAVTPPPSATVTEIDDAKAMEVLKGTYTGGPSLVLVQADFCGHCRNFKPVYAEAAASGSRAHFYSVDGTKARGVMAAHSITGFPTLLGVQGDGLVVKYSGPRTKEAVLAFAAKLIANNANKA